MTDFKVMLAHKYEPKRIKSFEGVYIEPKLDGVRVVARVDAAVHDPWYQSRNGRELKMLGHLDDEVVRLAARLCRLNRGYRSSGVFFDGELISATGNFEDISGVIHRKDVTDECKLARLHLFHAMPMEYFDSGKDSMPQEYRYECMQEAFSYANYSLLQHVPPLSVTSHEHIQRRYIKFREKGYEGAMVKNMLAPWEGKRSYNWLKMKAEDTVDVKIVGFKPGKGKYEGTLGALVCMHGKKEINVSGMTDKQRREIWDCKSDYLDKMCEVEYQNETNHGALRHPRFKRLRPDKDKP